MPLQHNKKWEAKAEGGKNSFPLEPKQDLPFLEMNQAAIQTESSMNHRKVP